ncbi:hypothetical protein Tco_0414536 [Tanacetum coccineum]
MPVEGMYSVEDVALLNTRRTPIQRQPEFLLCLVGLSRRYFLGDDVYPMFLYDDGRGAVSRVIDMEDVVIPSAMEKSPLDFSNEDPSLMITNRGETENPVLAETSQEDPPAENTTTAEVVIEVNLEKEVTVIGALVNKRRRKRDKSKTEANAPPKVLRTDHASVYPESMTRGGKSLAAMGLGADTPSYTPVQQSVSDPDPLSYARPQPIPEPDIAQSSKGATVAGDPDSEKSSSFTSFAGSPGGHGGPYGAAREVRLLKKAKEKVAKRDHRIQAQEEEIKKLDQEIRSLRAVDTEVTGEEQIKAAFEEFKKRKDDKVEKRCAEMDARLDALSIDFNEELYPHMLTAIASHRWVIEHGLLLTVMKCTESTELRQVFANVMSVRIAKGMSEGLKHGLEHGKAQLDLEAIEAYDLEADAKYVAALHALKDLKYPLIDQLEKLKDALIDLIMASLYLESDVGEDTPQWIRELRPSSSQLKITVYPEVRDPRDP